MYKNFGSPYYVMIRKCCRGIIYDDWMCKLNKMVWKDSLLNLEMVIDSAAVL